MRHTEPISIESACVCYFLKNHSQTRNSLLQDLHKESREKERERENIRIFGVNWNKVVDVIASWKSEKWLLCIWIVFCRRKDTKFARSHFVSFSITLTPETCFYPQRVAVAVILCATNHDNSFISFVVLIPILFCRVFVVPLLSSFLTLFCICASAT